MEWGVAHDKVLNSYISYILMEKFHLKFHFLLNFIYQILLNFTPDSMLDVMCVYVSPLWTVNHPLTSKPFKNLLKQNKLLFILFTIISNLISTLIHIQHEHYSNYLHFIFAEWQLNTIFLCFILLLRALVLCAYSTQAHCSQAWQLPTSQHHKVKTRI